MTQKHGNTHYKDFDFHFNYLCSFRKWWSRWRCCQSTVIYSQLGFTRGEEMVEHCFEIQRSGACFLLYCEVILDYVLFRVTLCYYQNSLRQNICTNLQFKFLYLTSKWSTNSRFWFAGSSRSLNLDPIATLPYKGLTRLLWLISFCNHHFICLFLVYCGVYEFSDLDRNLYKYAWYCHVKFHWWFHLNSSAVWRVTLLSHSNQ